MQTVPADLRARGAAVEAVVGAVWWAVGASVLRPGLGTLVLAAGLAIAAGLAYAGRRRPAYRERLHPEARRVVPVAALAGAALMVVAVLGVGRLGWGELAAPVACAVVGGCYLWAASRLQRRGEVFIGLALLALGGLGVLLALRSAGELYSRGLIGFGGGVVFWVAAAVRVGLHRRLLDQVYGGLGR